MNKPNSNSVSSIRNLRLKRFKLRLSRYFFSIHRFLVFSLLSILTIVMVLLAFLNYWQIQRQNERLFQTQLINSAQVLEALISLEVKKQHNSELARLLRKSSEMTALELKDRQANNVINLYMRYQNKFVFQVWNMHNNTLIMKSTNAPKWPLSDQHPGFQKLTSAKGKQWYSFAINNNAQHTQIIIAMRYDFAENINFALFFHDLTILFIVYILIAICILWTIQFSLQPLKDITTEIALRDAESLHPINMRLVPLEIRPLIKALNRLFKRVSDTLKREKSFTADAAHELRTPLAALKTQVEVAIREKDDAQRARILKNIIIGGNRCAHVVEQLLTLSRLEPEAKIEYQQKVNLTESSSQLVAELAPLAIDKNIEIELHAPEAPIFITGNHVSIGIMLRNLIANAIQYTPEHGNVSVILSELKSRIVLQVIDSGTGITAEARERIFDRFFRQLGNKTEGSGLGLSIVAQIVDLHNATIRVLLPKTGIGTEMRVSFPKMKRKPDQT